MSVGQLFQDLGNIVTPIWSDNAKSPFKTGAIHPRIQRPRSRGRIVGRWNVGHIHAQTGLLEDVARKICPADIAIQACAIRRAEVGPPI